ncbi:hypothetical protein AMTRI_Chr03g139010 [Amborella trichopoda]
MDLRKRWRKDLNAFGPNLNTIQKDLEWKPIPKRPSCRRKTIDLRLPSLSCS